MVTKLPLRALGMVILLAVFAVKTSVFAEESRFKRISPHFIAALGDPKANSGDEASTWGYWNYDPGKYGVWLRLFPVLKAAGGYAPGNWLFDENDWWLDENGLIMPKPEFPMKPGKYLVTGEREVTTTLTVYPPDANGTMKWELADQASLIDVTHMPCRSARYRPEQGQQCTPANADQTNFRVPPGSIMPTVPGCQKQDYAVLIVIGIEEKSAAN